MVLSSVLFTTSCSKDSELSNIQDNKWQELIGGAVDQEQNWITAVNVKLNIEANAGSVITAYTINNEEPTILAKKEMKGNGVMTIDVPQGIGESFGLQCSNGTSTEYKRIYLTGKKEQTVDVDFSSSSTLSRQFTTKSSLTRATSHNSELDGTSIIGNTGYSSFGGWAWESLANALPEAKNIGTNAEINHDYELTSEGPMYISFLYGYTGNYGNRILGYYYHSEGNYNDIVYQDISEALKYDYIDGLAKVQYQLDNNTDVWYDANFDYMDGDGLEKNKKTSSQIARRNDNAYNTLLAHKEYGDRVSAMRGLTFKVDVPKGKKFGFYLKLVEKGLSSTQKQNMIKEGVPEDKLPTNEINFSHMAFNVNGKNGQHRSGMRSYDNFTFMGLDDSDESGDMDCNDVTFGLLDQYGQPYSDPPKSVQSWTIGYEDRGTDLDFDFNDVVIRVTPNTYEHTAKVELLAKGGALKTELYYGDQNLGEIHSLMGVSQSTTVNTTVNSATIAPVLVSETLPWPDGYTISNNSNLFKIKVYKTNGDIIWVSTDAYLQNSIPQAVCVAGNWAWPKEYTKISDAYPVIGEWGKNVKDQNFWNWYSSPVQDNIVTPYSE